MRMRRWLVGPVAAQVAGGAVVVAGVWLLAGLAVALILAGVLLAGFGALREAGRV